MEIKIIIGANFGDEGKGMATNYFAKIAKNNKTNCLVVMHNGGAQKGHTIFNDNGIRHVTSSFGSGVFQDADTYMSEEYIVNPIYFKDEFLLLRNKNITPKCFINHKAKITTPYDIFINQILEFSRNKNKHGSCGLGIYETILRTKEFKLTYGDIVNKSDLELKNILKNIKNNYVFKRLKDANISSVPTEYLDAIYNEEIIDEFIKDLSFLTKNTNIIEDESEFLNLYNYIIFEGAQGLLLDQNNTEYFPHLTPSNTGLTNPLKIIKNIKKDKNIEVIYITRTYLTRHGAGKFPTETSKENINANIVDITNIFNNYQENIRYGYFDEEDFLNRINKDLAQCDINIDKSIFITHLNYTNNKLCCKNELKSIKDFFKNTNFNIYLSNDENVNNIKILS